MVHSNGHANGVTNGLHPQSIAYGNQQVRHLSKTMLVSLVAPAAHVAASSTIVSRCKTTDRPSFRLVVLLVVTLTRTAADTLT